MSCKKIIGKYFFNCIINRFYDLNIHRWHLCVSFKAFLFYPYLLKSFGLNKSIAKLLSCVVPKSRARKTPI